MSSKETKYNTELRAVRFSYDNDELLRIALTIRKLVFVDEQKIDPDLEFDGYDKDAQHFLLYFKSEPVATARWRETDAGIKLERFAVMKQFRNHGYGSKLMAFIMQQNLTGKHLYFHSQLSAVGFYEALGFEKDGELFYEAGIPHYAMKKATKPNLQ
ncbi:MAG: GNAT family N-acetyltransferase [Bacteroidales bacterium]|jgi:predicted GNAT family N-acyltransferase|nr:GNAT family N-acetyltransferase [Bacteroidales bacterium]HOY38550.1 GNAT family N-acetyltransferase [Bacteroidales bacterium]HQP03551.1 GNAT family N-acetyltransferase [Bacteroidales bacterium]